MNKRKQRFWCGFTDGQPSFDDTYDEYTGEKPVPQLSVFRSRREALKRFEDVREVVIPTAGKTP